MKLYDQATQDLAQAVQHVLEGKAPVKEMEMKYPHDMFDPKTGKKEVAKDEAGHKALAAKGYTHEAPEENVADPTDKSDDQNTDKVRKMHGVKKIDLGEEIDAAHDEAIAIEEARKDDESMDEAELSAKQAAYKKVFDAAMKKFGVKSPAELEDGKKKEFFDYVDANYEADGEVKEGVGDFFNKAKKKVQRAADKVTGGDSSGDKAKAGIEGQIKALEDKIERAVEKIKISDRKLKDKEISSDAADKTEDYQNEVINNAEAKIDELKQKLK